MPLSDSSAARWIQRVSDGDELAVEKLWSIYFERLVYLAHGRLCSKLRRVVDAEDIALSAFHSFCRGVEQKRFPSLSDKDSLWRLLVTITLHKTLRAIRDQGRIKRGGQFKELAGISSDTDVVSAIQNVVSQEPSPEFAIEVAEQYTIYINALNDSELARIAHWKMEGYSNREVANMLDKSERTVERKLQLIRKIWVKMVEED